MRCKNNNSRSELLFCEIYIQERFSCVIHVAEGPDVEEVCRGLYSTCAVISESPPVTGDVSSQGCSLSHWWLLCRVVRSSWIWCVSRPAWGTKRTAFCVITARLSDDACLCNISMCIYLFICLVLCRWLESSCSAQGPAVACREVGTGTSGSRKCGNFLA